jgi:hypothetical protein
MGSRWVAPGWGCGLVCEWTEPAHSQYLGAASVPDWQRPEARSDQRVSDSGNAVVFRRGGPAPAQRHWKRGARHRFHACSKKPRFPPTFISTPLHRRAVNCCPWSFLRNERVVGFPGTVFCALQSTYWNGNTTHSGKIEAGDSPHGRRAAANSASADGSYAKGDGELGGGI